MAADNPGLAPRKLEGDVEMKVESSRLSEAETPEQPAVDQKQPEQTQVKTEANVQQQTENEKAQQPQMSERELNRVQKLANEKAQAEARATQAEEMLRRLVNAPMTPNISEDEMLAKQYKSFDANVGYPLDPKEYAQFTRNQAKLEGKKAAQEEFESNRKNADIADLLEADPEILNDSALFGAIIAEQADAQKKGVRLTLRKAKDLVENKLEKRYRTKAQADVLKDANEKNEAYVETGRGGSSSRGSTTETKDMTMDEMEHYLKDQGLWDQV